MLVGRYVVGYDLQSATVHELCMRNKLSTKGSIAEKSVIVGLKAVVVDMHHAERRNLTMWLACMHTCASHALTPYTITLYNNPILNLGSHAHIQSSVCLIVLPRMTANGYTHRFIEFCCY